MSERTLLIISHLPHASPRIPGLAKYLPDFGWRPIIISGRSVPTISPGVRVIETPYALVLSFWKRLLGLDPGEGFRVQLTRRMPGAVRHSRLDRLCRLFAQVVNYPDAHRRWQRAARGAIAAFLDRERIEAILSSSSPVTAHLIAREIHAHLRVPWIADLRDLWTQNHNYDYGSLRKVLDRRLERKTLRPAASLVTASEPWAERLRALHPGKPVYAIPNGFDPEDLRAGPSNLTPEFSITYTGSIYVKQGDPSKLFQALRELIAEGAIGRDDVAVRFYGPVEKWVEEEIARHGLSSAAVQYGIVPRDVCMEKQRESQALLLLNWDDQREKGAYSLKAFEYLAARRPILAIGGSNGDVVSQLLAETRAGVCTASVTEIKAVLRNLYSEYKAKGEVEWRGDPVKVNRYSHREMARRFAAILDTVADLTGARMRELPAVSDAVAMERGRE